MSRKSKGRKKAVRACYELWQDGCPDKSFDWLVNVTADLLEEDWDYVREVALEYEREKSKKGVGK